MSTTLQSGIAHQAQGTGDGACPKCGGTGFLYPNQDRGTAGLAQAASGVVVCECRRAQPGDPERVPMESGRVEGHPSLYESHESIALMLRSGRSSRRGVEIETKEHLVVKALAEALGRERAVPRKEITRLTGLSEREVKGVVERLRYQHGLKVGSDRRRWGYYWIESADELADTAVPFLRQALTMLKTYDALTDGKHAFHRLLLEKAGQVKLRLE